MVHFALDEESYLQLQRATYPHSFANLTGPARFSISDEHISEEELSVEPTTSAEPRTSDRISPEPTAGSSRGADPKTADTDSIVAEWSAVTGPSGLKNAVLETSGPTNAGVTIAQLHNVTGGEMDSQDSKDFLSADDQSVSAVVLEIQQDQGMVSHHRPRDNVNATAGEGDFLLKNLVFN